LLLLLKVPMYVIQIVVTEKAVLVSIESVHRFPCRDTRSKKDSHIDDCIKRRYPSPVCPQWTTNIVYDIVFLLPDIPYAVEVCMVQKKEWVVGA
jgi:hypothetical protein